MGVFRRGENGPAPMPPVMRRPNPPPQSAAEIKAKVTSMCAGVEKTGEAVISDVNRLVSEAKRGELVLVRLIDAYEERTQRARQVMSDLMSKGLCELEDALRKANDEAMNHLESRVSPDTEAPRFDVAERQTEQMNRTYMAKGSIDPILDTPLTRDKLVFGGLELPRAKLGEPEVKS